MTIQLSQQSASRIRASKTDRARVMLAFTLTEMLFALALMGVAAVLSARLFHASIQTMYAAPQIQAHEASIDRMSAVLRRDVWGAKSIDVPDDHAIELSQPDSTKIRWHWTNSEAIRKDSAGEQRWSTDVALGVEHRDGVIVLSATSDPSVGRDELHFVTQPVPAGEASR